MRIFMFRGAGIAAAAITLPGLLACSPSAGAPPGSADGGGYVAASDDDAAGNDGAGSGQDAGADLPTGTVVLTQASMQSAATMQEIYNFSIAAAFVSPGAATDQRAAITTVGNCTATAVPIDPDAGTRQAPPALNAGTITVTGIGMPPSEALVYDPGGDAGGARYLGVKGDTAFYSGGDVVTVQGTGGPDLPAFTAQALTAPSDILLMAPACAGLTCPGIDRAKDLLVQWTGGGAGKVLVTFETIAPTQVVLLQCKFDVSAGTGTVPSSLLTKLDKAGDPNITGVEQISPMNEVRFVVGTANATFTIQSADIESILTISN